MTLTFLFTDLENSTSLWEQFPNAMRPALARHDLLMQKAVETHNGRVVKTTGDGVHAVFESAANGIAAALAGQQAVSAENWPTETGPLKVRMGLHTGESQERDGDYYGPTLNRAARVMGIGYGGQILCSETTKNLVKTQLPPDCSLSDLGQHRLKGIATAERIFQLCHPDLATEFPPLKSLSAFKHNLPVQLSSFVGRSRELAEVKRLLSQTRLLTLLGPGGTGKTRLMLQTAEELIDDYPNGVWLVELAPLTDPDLVAERVAAALNVQEQPGRAILDTLTASLRRKELLLLLDNVEHLVRESAELAEHLLLNCPDIKILVTGRESLFISGETTLQIPSLSLPKTKGDITPAIALNSEGVQLFLDRAQAVRPDFEIRADNVAAVVDIVKRLDGIPLALELAAARIRMLRVEQINERLNDRFRLLTGGRRTALPRQQTLQALIDWSWNLLDDKERVLLQRLSVFSGGWTMTAAQAVTGFDPLDEFDVFDLLEQLINKSLVVVEHPPEGETRYGLLESIRQYGRDRLFELGEGEPLRERHAAYFVAFGERASIEVEGRDALIWLNRLIQETDNINIVREWTLENRLDMALRMTTMSMISLRYWFFTPDGVRWLEQVVQKTRSHLATETDIEYQRGLAGALIALGSTKVGTGSFNEGQSLLEEGIDLARQLGIVKQRVFGLNMLMIIYLNMEDFTAMESVGEEALSLCREHNLGFLHQMTLGTYTPIFVFQEKHEQAQVYIEEATELARQLDNPWVDAMSLFLRGRHAETRGNLREAERCFSESAVLFEAVRDAQFPHVARSDAAHVKRALGDLAGAEEIYRQTIVTFYEWDHGGAVAHQLECFGFMAQVQGRNFRSAKLLAAAEAIRQAIQVERRPSEQAEYEQTLEQLGQVMGQPELDKAMAEGKLMSLDEAVSLALVRS